MTRTAKESMHGIIITDDKLSKLWQVVDPGADVLELSSFGSEPLSKSEILNIVGVVSVLHDGTQEWYVDGKLVANVNWGVGYCDVNLCR